jgi:hypothetical protein
MITGNLKKLLNLVVILDIVRAIIPVDSKPYKQDSHCESSEGCTHYYSWTSMDLKNIFLPYTTNSVVCVCPLPGPGIHHTMYHHKNVVPCKFGENTRIWSI